ncbi:MAG: hypothetical protein JW388_1550 [Nitrospira sp.]|nr:hypothetical protein [Nitrospira sp.]
MHDVGAVSDCECGSRRLIGMIGDGEQAAIFIHLRSARGGDEADIRRAFAEGFPPDSSGLQCALGWMIGEDEDFGLFGNVVGQIHRRFQSGFCRATAPVADECERLARGRHRITEQLGLGTGDDETNRTEGARLENLSKRIGGLLSWREGAVDGGEHRL